MGRVAIKKGDVFSVKIDENRKRYFQYVTNDLKQLNSDVIRGFSKIYSIDENPNIEELVKDDVLFYAHCVSKWGVKLGFWTKIGNIKNVGTFEHVLFRDTNDYGAFKSHEFSKFSNNWYIWHINDKDFTFVGKLSGDNLDSYTGIVINPKGIVELLKGNKYPVNYPVP